MTPPLRTALDQRAPRCCGKSDGDPGVPAAPSQVGVIARPCNSRAQVRARGRPDGPPKSLLPGWRRPAAVRGLLAGILGDVETHQAVRCRVVQKLLVGVGP